MSGYEYGKSGTRPPADTAAAERARNGLAPGQQPSLPKGIAKVAGFPARYPFQMIADAGGVFTLDPAAFRAKPQSVRSAASKWAAEHGLSARTALHEGLVYVQFTKAE